MSNSMEKQQTVGSKEMASQSEDVSQQIREEYRNIQQEIQEKSDAESYIKKKTDSNKIFRSSVGIN